MASEDIKSLVNDLQNQIQKESKDLELILTINYLISLVEPKKREIFKRAIDSAESMEDAYQILDTLKMQIGAQGARKLLKL
ncbi:hypothetical protein KKP97_06745 [Methanothermococcus sp. SCGC AD-155-C09]|nr:hypothetical protein [Methanothermococcus sp. SCGC AD-155-C09]MBW9222724.1 hypothetical protein [Methanothermococcus sp. SCGC AD-155-C09]